MDAYSWLKRSLSRPKKTSSLPSSDAHLQQKSKESQDGDEEQQLYGVTEQLIDFIKSFTLDTFKNFPLQDEKAVDSGGGDGAPTTSSNLRKDLSDWQERHATLVLSKVKELSNLRFRLCPRYLKEQEFWRIYFTLVKSYVAKYELHAIRLAQLKQLRVENENSADTNACEVEMSEAKQVASEVPVTSLEPY
ncbi:unnamed protein product [Ilex paraguariensis]|uniref:BSD domain-containing protein n=1 Tax=Ilex paraguariensis TaxID=185542 RepID=A0ABC8SZ30_9AQUA